MTTITLFLSVFLLINAEHQHLVLDPPERLYASDSETAASTHKTSIRTPIMVSSTGESILQQAVAKDVVCGIPGDQQAYTKNQIKCATNAAKDLLKKKTTVNGYPHPYYSLDAAVVGAMPMHLRRCSQVKHYVFPITPSEILKANTDHGPDRVVVAEIQTGQPKQPVIRTYCSTITHRGLPAGVFRPARELPTTQSTKNR